MSKNINNLADLIISRSENDKGKIIYSYISSFEEEPYSITYDELYLKSVNIALKLQSNENLKNKRAVLLFPFGMEYIFALFGCILSGVIAVPVYLPKSNKSLSRIVSILKNCDAEYILCEKEKIQQIESFINDYELNKIKIITTEFDKSLNKNIFKKVNLNEDDVAFLQYTSGSTGDPKGVMVTHGNVLHNSEYIRRLHNTSENSVGASWLPMFHDMGLIDGVFQPLYTGFPTYLFPPVKFLQNPIMWLKVISKYKVTHSGGPNFAYNLCINKIKDVSNDLNLSNWENAYCGAEPVRKKTLIDFYNKFSKYGFKLESFHPCYGLAEATLVVTGGTFGKKVNFYEYKLSLENNKSTWLVSNGKVWGDTEIKIVHPTSREVVKDGLVGEIWINSPSIAKGYWENKLETEKNFNAYIKGDCNKKYFRTGDLGLIFQNELYVTGRLKDVIIINGVNYYPSDLEDVALASTEFLNDDSIAVFSIDVEFEEKIFLVGEVKRSKMKNLNIEEVCKNIRHSIWKEFNLQIVGVVLVSPVSIPKTSSNKIQRRACRDLFIKGQLKIIGSNFIPSYQKYFRSQLINK